jgi:hypothetical protein
MTSTRRDEYPRYAEIQRITYDAIKYNGMSTCAPERILEASKAAGLVDVTRHDYATLGRSGRNAQFQRNGAMQMRQLLPIGLMRSGKVADAASAQKMGEAMAKEVDEMFAAGVVPVYAPGLIVARKLLE